MAYFTNKEYEQGVSLFSQMRVESKQVKLHRTLLLVDAWRTGE